MTQGLIKINIAGLEKYLEGAKMTQTDFAKAIDFDAGNFSRTINGELEPSKPLIKKMMYFTGYPFDALFIYDRFAESVSE